MSNRFIALVAAAALAASASAALAQDGLGVTASTIDRPLTDIRPTAADGAAAHSPGTVGAMHYAVAGVATSTADVQRESRGLLTTPTVRWRASAQPGS